MPASENIPTAPAAPIAILRLTVKNHSGVMLQICGLFARRGFNLEGIFCASIGQGETSRIWLAVGAGANLDQVIKQLAKLEDVLAIEERDDARCRIGELGSMLARIG